MIENHKMIEYYFKNLIFSCIIIPQKEIQIINLLNDHLILAPYLYIIFLPLL